MVIEELVAVYYSKLNENDLIIWEYIKEHMEECSGISIENLAKKCNVSRTTISRFAKKLHLEGFAELKYNLKKNQSNLTRKEEQIDINEIFHNYHFMLDDIRHKDFTLTAQMIEEAEKIIIVATGTMQHLAAQELQRLFMKSGKFMNIVMGAAEMRQLSNWMTEKDLVIFISLSGEKMEAVNLARNLKVKGVQMISITKVSRNSLAEYADEAIYVQFGDVQLSGVGRHMNLAMFFTIIELMYVYYYNYLLE